MPYLKTGFALLLCLGLCVPLSGCFEPIKDTHPDQVLTKRRALFKQFTRTLEPMGLVASGRKEYKPDEFLAMVQDLEKLSTKPWVYFPTDGNYSPTRAKEAVWSQPQAFKAAQDHYQASVQALLLAARTSQLEPVQQAMDKVINSCKACHKDFRYE
ncbi:cytochrome C [Rhodoferax lacus]|uniref:Cytochrome C n=1 Tax=Rhodoferax lacus TaxID=2184758 RepID=A0A3E1R981_9BURK|nr:cytochrome c [Rhodoferax lacus]RFO95919.1 cytochrome C [Rhodoferax lacus]